MEGRYPRVLPVIFILYIFNMKKSYISLYIYIDWNITYNYNKESYTASN